MKPTKFTNEAELKALFDHAVRAIGFYMGHCGIAAKWRLRRAGFRALR